MVDDGAVDRLSSDGELAGSNTVRMARVRFVARVIVGENDARAAKHGCVSDYGPDREAGAASIAIVPGKPDAVCLLVDVCNPQALSSGIGLGETAGKEFAGGFGSIQLERLRGTLKAHPN